MGEPVEFPFAGAGKPDGDTVRALLTDWLNKERRQPFQALLPGTYRLRPAR